MIAPSRRSTGRGSIVGRERELATISSFLDGGQQPGRALLLEGEAGIGKTILWRAGTETASELGYRVLKSRAAEAETQLAFTTVRDLLDDAFDEIADELPPPQRNALAVVLLREAPDERPADPATVAVAFLTSVRLLASGGPTLLAVDDTQWLDQPSRETLAYALRRLEGESVALLAAHRPGGAEFAPDPAERVVVTPLSLGALGVLLRSRADARMTRPMLVRVHETSGGNPFFALELVRALDGNEPAPGEPLPVPATLSALTASRFDGLEPDTLDVLLHVAALARPTREVVRVAAGEGADAALDAAAAAGVIETDGDRLWFTHPLLASMHYGSAAPGDRERVHRRLAAVVTDAEERGRHLGAATTEPDAEVAAALDEAALAARARGAPVVAAELGELALRLTPPAGSESLQRLRAAAEHEFAAGSTARARSLLEQALAAAPRGPEHARVALQLASLLDTQDLGAERRLLDEALLECEDDVALQARLHHQLAIHFDGLDYHASCQHSYRAFELAERSGERELIAETLAWAADRNFASGAGIDHELIRRGLALEESLTQIPLMSRPSCTYAYDLTWSGELERARLLWEQLRSLGRSEGDPDVIHILFFSTYHELMAENWEQAARFADEAWALAIEAERDVEVSQCRRVSATVAAYRGEEEPTRSSVEEAHRLGVAAGVAEHRLSRLALGILDLSLGEPESALAHLRTGIQRKLSTGMAEPGLLLGFPEYVEAAVTSGEHDEATGVLDSVEEHARRLDRAWALGCCARGRALLEAARGDEAAAEAAFAAAYEQHARRPQQLATYELARTSLLHGSMLRGRRQRRQAREALERALAIFDRLGSRVYAERTRSELARIGGRAPSGDELTPSERRIAELVVEGKSNKEVATILVVTDRTVESALTHIYRKLDIRSRTQLARKLSSTDE